MRIHVLVLPLVVAAGAAMMPASHREPPGGEPAPRAGISTSQEFTVQTLVQDIFVKGGCKNISNIRAIGNAGGIGYFENGGPVIGLEKGIIISTGHIRNAEGPNTETDKSGDFGDGSGDRDLNLLASDRVYDAVGFEFDFVPLDSIVTFRYVFASEEYCEYVGSKFNDVFGFFISGPGFSGSFSGGGVNVALLPGSGDYVSINSINHTRNAQYYVPNELESDARTCSKPYTASPLQAQIEFDGFTKGLIATLRLIPCETYHLRLVVGDVSDTFYDSAVFLEAESFNIGGEVTVSPQAQAGDGAVVEGCPNGGFLFRRVNTDDLSRDVEVRFQIDPSSTAVEGVDYETLPRSVVIPAGRLTTLLPVNAYNDLQTEAPEFIKLALDYPCDCVTGDAMVRLVDPPAIQLALADVEICPGGEATLRPAVGGGTPPFTYRWNNADTAAAITVAPAQTTPYSVTVTDACGQQLARDARVILLTPPRADISGYQDLCPGGQGALSVAFTGQAPWQFAYTIDGEDEQTLSGLRDNPFRLPVSREGVYQLTSVSDSRCPGSTSGSGRVDITRLKIEAEARGVTCHGLADGRVDVVVSGGDLPYTYLWDQNQGERKNLQNVPAGAYTLQVTDAKGCRDTAFALVGSPPPLDEVTFDCLDLGTDSIAFTTGGGTPPYRFSVDGVNFLDASIFAGLEEGRLYNLVIRDGRGCRREQEFVMPANTKTYINLPGDVSTILGQKYVFDPQLLIPPSLVRSYNWSPFRDLSCTDCLQPVLIPQENSIYTLRVTDRFGCWSEATVIVNVNRQPSVFIPTAFSPNNDGHNDVFMIFADPDQVRRVRSLRVFNRWGTLLHEIRDVAPNDPASGWDGRFRGQWQDPGLYVYYAEIELVNGNVLFETGDVALMR